MTNKLRILLIGSILLVCAASPAAAQNTKVVLTWTPSTTPGAVTDVYRATTLGGPYAKLTSTPVPNGTNTYTDSASLVNGATYWYVVTTTANGVTSQFSQGAIPVCFNCVTQPATVLGATQSP